MKKSFLFSLLLLLAIQSSNSLFAQNETYTPSAENLKARAEFQDAKFGIFYIGAFIVFLPKVNGTCKMQVSTVMNMQRLQMPFIRTTLTHTSGLKLSKTRGQNIFVSQQDTMMVFRCGTHNKATTTLCIRPMARTS